MKSIKVILPALVIGFLILVSQTAASESKPTPTLGFKLVGSGFSLPTGVTSTGVPGDERLFVIEKNGRIRVLENGEIREADFLNISDMISTNSERGLLGIAFDPNYVENGYFYINYSDGAEDTFGDTVVARYTVSEDPNVADPGSALTIIEIEQDFENHNGGGLAFDPNNNLVIGMGDGGSGGDPFNRALSRNTLLGKMIRINVHGDGLPADENGCGRVRNYHIPSDNPRPFGEDDWCPEIWSYGWRNPWRFSFDAVTGDMWAGDVGQNAFEEINFEAFGSAPLQNYGWRCHEGFSVYGPANCTIDPAERTDPVTDYPRSEGTSVTGGYVYRGTKYSNMQGVYVFGDFVSGQMWALVPDGNGFVETTLEDTSFGISSFGEGSDDEIYLANFSPGEIYQLIGPFGADVTLEQNQLVRPAGEISFDIEIVNIGTADLNAVEVKASIPAKVSHLSGGTASSEIVTFTISNLPAGESQTLQWSGRVSNQANLVSASTVSVTAQELSTPITVDSDQSTNTLVVKNEIFLPAIGRDVDALRARCTSFDLEPNNTRAEAQVQQPLPNCLNVQLSGNFGGNEISPAMGNGNFFDTFLFENTISAPITIQLDGIPNNSNYDLWLTNQDGIPIVQATAAENTAETIRLEEGGLESGTYFISVINIGGINSAEAYSLRISRE